MTAGSQGTPGKQGESAQVTWGDGDPRLTAVARSGYSSAPAGTSVDEALLILGMVASGLVRLSAGRLGDDEDDEEEVGVISLLVFDLVTEI